MFISIKRILHCIWSDIWRFIGVIVLIFLFDDTQSIGFWYFIMGIVFVFILYVFAKQKEINDARRNDSKYESKKDRRYD